jgi:surface antigen
LLRGAQGKALRGVMFAGSWSKLLALVLPIGLAACASGNALSRAETDRSIITGSVANAASTHGVTDEETIRNAATSVDPGQLGPDGLAWTNPATGAKGQITGLSEYQENGHLCRRFSTSITRFDGISLYHGEACLDDPGGWRLRALAAS